MLSVLKTLKLWQVVVLLLVVFAIAGGVYGIYGWASGSSTSSLSANTQLVRVQYGNLTNSVSASGSLIFAIGEELTFGSAGTVQGVNVKEGDEVKKGDVLANLDNTSVLSLQEAVTSARIALRDAEEALEKAQNPYTEAEIAKANAAVQQAQQQLLVAQAEGPLDIADAEDALDNAEKNYSATILLFMDGKTSLQELNAAERNWERAKLNLETVKQNADKAVVDAQYNLANAEEALANMKVDTLDVELKQAQVTSAQTALDEALARLENTNVVAPFDGVVSAVNVEAGDTVNAGTVIIKIVDPSDIEVSAIVDEIDVAQVQVGQKATVTLDAYSDFELSGVVSSISSFANSQSGVVSYPVTIKLTIPSGVQLREGMSATATITVKEVDNVLLVPTKVISGKSSANPTVVVMVNGTSETRAVKVGESDDEYTEIVSGLNAGDVVVFTASSTSRSTSSTNLPGGFPGGGTIINFGP